MTIKLVSDRELELEREVAALRAELELEKANTRIFLDSAKIVHDKLGSENTRLYEKLAQLEKVIPSPKGFIAQPRMDGVVRIPVDCSGRLDAPHGVDLEASFRTGRTVCVCKSWTPRETA